MKLTTRLLALLLALCMVFAFAACGKDPANPDPVDPSNPVAVSYTHLTLPTN